MFHNNALKGLTDMIRTYAVVLIISMAVVWAGGCQEEQVSSDVKQSRLIAAENRDLQQETKKRDDEIKNLNAQSQVEMKKKDEEIKKLSEQLKKAQASSQAEITKRDDEVKNIKDQLFQCEKARDTKMEDVQKEMGDRYVGLITDLTSKDSELTAEVDRLKAELVKIRGEEKK
jgi:flagellar motility protein MotE (MotC chaperone)